MSIQTAAKEAKISYVKNRLLNLHDTRNIASYESDVKTARLAVAEEELKSLVDRVKSLQGSFNRTDLNIECNVATKKLEQLQKFRQIDVVKIKTKDALRGIVRSDQMIPTSYDGDIKKYEMTVNNCILKVDEHMRLLKSMMDEQRMLENEVKMLKDWIKDFQSTKIQRDAKFDEDEELFKNELLLIEMMDDYYKYAEEMKIPFLQNSRLEKFGAMRDDAYWETYYTPGDEYEAMVRRCNEHRQSVLLLKQFSNEDGLVDGRCLVTMSNCTGWYGGSICPCGNFQANDWCTNEWESLNLSKFNIFSSVPFGCRV